MPSSKQPMPSGDAGFDPSHLPNLRRRAGELLAARGVFGLVWLHPDLTVHTSFGTLVDFIAVGQPVTRSLAPVIGLESDIRALKAGQTLRIPSVTIVSDGGPGPRLNLVFHAFEADDLTLMVVSHAEVDTKLAMELSRQIRGRLMAESEVAAKSQVAPASLPSTTPACSSPSARSAAAGRAWGSRSCRRCSTPSAERSRCNRIRR